MESASSAAAALPPVIHVERDRHARELVSLFLTRAGFTVEAVDNGHSGLERIRQLSRAIVITEILVPGLDGLSLCRVVKSDPTLSTCVIVLSMLSAGERSRQAGADAYLSKPIEPNTLVSTVQSVCGDTFQKDRSHT